MHKCKDCDKYHILKGPGAELEYITVDTLEEALKANDNYLFNVSLFNRNKLN